MYGTVARMRVSGSASELLTQLQEDMERTNVPGMVAGYVLRSDKDPQEHFMVAVFESKEAYMANADSPQQDARFRRLRELLASDPEWNDGEIVSQTLRQPART